MESMKNLQDEERGVIMGQLMPEFQKLFLAWNYEYSTQARDLGAIGETVNLWRKAKRVKAAMIDGVDTVGWREPLRIILFELICHAFLLIFDLDKADAEMATDFNDTGILVPNCGHPRCIDHVKVPMDQLRPETLDFYRKEMDVDGNAADTG